MASKSLLLDLLKKKNQIFILSWKVVSLQLTKDKYGASNLNGPQTVKNTVFIHTTRFTARLYIESFKIYYLEDGKAWF
jgi:hypothetical protein